MMNQREFLAITCNFLKAREKSREQGAIGFGLAPHWLKTGAKFFSQSPSVIAFKSHLKTDLKREFSHRCAKNCSIFLTI